MKTHPFNNMSSQPVLNWEAEEEGIRKRTKRETEAYIIYIIRLYVNILKKHSHRWLIF